MEIIAIQLRKAENIKGISIGDIYVKLTQLADDMTCFTSYIPSLFNIVSVIVKFAKISGLRLNKCKCALMGIYPKDIANFFLRNPNQFPSEDKDSGNLFFYFQCQTL